MKKVNMANTKADGIWPTAEGKWTWSHLLSRFLHRPSAIYLLPLATVLLLPPPAHALTITGVAFSDTNITCDERGVPNGTTISFTINDPGGDPTGQAQIAVNCGIQNFGDAGTNVANLTQNYAVGVSTQIFWNGLWLINGQLGRQATTCDFHISVSTERRARDLIPGDSDHAEFRGYSQRFYACQRPRQWHGNRALPDLVCARQSRERDAHDRQREQHYRPHALEQIASRAAVVGGLPAEHRVVAADAGLRVDGALDLLQPLQPVSP